MRDSMIKKFTTFIIFITLVLGSSIAFSQTTGSIGGTITDAKENTPLVGATVKIAGSNMGAITDDNGEYIILNVEVGTYSLEASYIGYDSKKVTNVKVSVDQRTKINFQLQVTGGITTEVIVIEAERKGIEVDQSGRLVTQESIDNAGLRGITNIASKTAGVITDERGTSINIRGGRSSENLIIVDGMATTNPLDGSSSAYVPNSLMQEVSVLTGGFGAEYGNALAGVINVSTRRGTERYSGSAEVISDVLAGDWIKTVSQGYNLYNFTLSGPLFPEKGLANVINFAGAVERQWLKSYQNSWIGEKIYPYLEDPRYKDYKITPNNSQSLWNYSGRLSINLNETKAQIPINLRFGFMQTQNNRRFFSSAYMMANIDRMPRAEQMDQQIYGRLVHNVTSKFFYELQFNRYRTVSETGDNIWWDDVYKYGDTLYNPQMITYGYQQGSNIGADPNYQSLFSRAGTIYGAYSKTDVSYMGGKVDATWAINSKKAGDHEVKFGGEYRYHTLKQIAANYAYELAMTDLDPMSIWYGRNNSGRFYGYEVKDRNGNLVDPTTVDPYHPIVAGAYLRDKIDFGDFTVNAGVRMDYLDVNTKVLKNIAEVYNTNTGQLLSPDLYVDNDKEILFSPRLGFSFPITDKMVFSANFGKFVQMPNLSNLYISRNAFYAALNNSVQDVYENPTLKPEKLTQYEISVKQRVGDFVDMGLTVYYRETKDQIGIKRVSGQIINGNPTSGYATYYNTDFSISRGLEFYLSLRRMNRLAVDFAYTLLYASGIGSNPDSKFYLGNNADPTNPDAGFPNYVFPLDYDQRHTGSVNVDYRFGTNDVPQGFLGQVLKQLGLNVLFSFNSGRPYTARELPTTYNGDDGRVLSTKNSLYTNWSLRFDLKLDKNVQIWKSNWNFYVYVQNLLNAEIVNSVFGATGLPGDNGYLNTPTGSSSNAAYKYYEPIRLKAIYYRNWGSPRQVRFGIRVSL